jgi:hypothetical protein
MIEDSNQNEAYNDLCVTCKYFSSCISVRNGTRPVYYCEEFEAYTYRPVKESTTPAQADKKEEKLVFNGLCKNCGNRMTCMMASPDRIIWHCEEYV